MNRRFRILCGIVPVALTAGIASAQLVHYPVNDDQSHEVSIQGSADHTPYEVCDPPLGTLGGSFLDSAVGDEVYGEWSPNDNHYAVFSFDTQGWACGGVYTLVLVELERWGDPFGELGPGIIAEFLSSATQYPDRLGNPDEVEGAGFSLLGAYSDLEFYDNSGISISSAVNSLVCGAHERYLYLRFRFPLCSNADQLPDFTEIAMGPGTPGRIHIFAQASPAIPALNRWGLAVAGILLLCCGYWRLRS